MQLRIRPGMALAAALAAWGASTPAGATEELLYGAEGNNLRRFDTDTIGANGLRQQILIQRASAADDGGARSQLDQGDPLGFVVVNDALFGSAVASAATVSGGIVLVGGGVGARSSNPQSVSDQTSRIPHDLVALCVAGTPPCPAARACGLGFELALLAPLLARLRRVRRRD